MNKFTLLKIFMNLHPGLVVRFLNEKPDRVNTLLDLAKAPADYLRNGEFHVECLLFIGKISTGNEDICKLLAFQGIFELLCEIVREEDDVIAKDSWALMGSLMSKFNRDYIREIPVLFSTLSQSLQGKSQDQVVGFILKACAAEQDEFYSPNLKFFSRLLIKLTVIAYPANGTQNPATTKLLKLLVKHNPAEVQALTSAESSDLIDLVLTYSVTSANNENIEVLVSLIEACPHLSENFVSRVTCVPGFVAVPGQAPIFNYLLGQVFDGGLHLAQVCRVLEIVLFSNEQAKQLAIHLPVDLDSNTLLTKVLGLWNSAMQKNGLDKVCLARLLLVWMHDSIETCHKSNDVVFNMIPTILKSMSANGIFESLAALLLGVISYQSKSVEIRKLVLSQVEYQDFKNKIEHLAQLPDFKKAASASSGSAVFGSITYPLVKIYTASVQPVIRYFVKGLTESAPKDQKDLAKLFEVHEAFTSMQYLRQGPPGESAQQDLQIKALKQDLESKTSEAENLKLEVRKVALDKDREIRRIVHSFLTVQEKLDLAGFELESYKRENSSLRVKNERLVEELQVLSGKKLEKLGELKIIEVKEQWKLQINENRGLKEMLQRKSEEYEEALEVIARLKIGAGGGEGFECGLEGKDEGMEGRDRVRSLQIENSESVFVCPGEGKVREGEKERAQVADRGTQYEPWMVEEVKEVKEESFEFVEKRRDVNGLVSSEMSREAEDLLENNHEREFFMGRAAGVDTENIPDWLKASNENSDPFKFFDNLETTTKTNSFF